jgi:hypothetical protein
MKSFDTKMEADFRDRVLDENPALGMRGDCRLESKVNGMKAKASARKYKIKGIEYDQGEAMEWIVQKMTDSNDPMSLKDASRVPGAPTLREIFAWRRDYPSFDGEMMTAESIRALLLAEGSLEIVMDEDDPKAAGLVKVKAESLRWMASKMDPGKFADRKIETKEDPFKDSSVKQIMDALRESIKANAEIIKSLSYEEKKQFEEMGVIDVTPETSDV